MKAAVVFSVLICCTIVTPHTYAQFTVEAGADAGICQGAIRTLGGSPTASGGSGTYSYSWTPVTGLSDPSAANPEARPLVTTTYKVQVTSGGETKEASVTISVSLPMTITLPASPVKMCKGVAKDIQILVTGGQPPLKYFWTTPEGSTETSKPALTWTAQSAGVYSVVVTDKYLCEARAEFQVELNVEPVIVPIKTNWNIPVGSPVVLSLKLETPGDLKGISWQYFDVRNQEYSSKGKSGMSLDLGTMTAAQSGDRYIAVYEWECGTKTTAEMVVNGIQTFSRVRFADGSPTTSFDESKIEGLYPTLTSKEAPHQTTLPLPSANEFSLMVVGFEAGSNRLTPQQAKATKIVVKVEGIRYSLDLTDPRLRDLKVVRVPVDPLIQALDGKVVEVTTTINGEEDAAYFRWQNDAIRPTFWIAPEAPAPGDDPFVKSKNDSRWREVNPVALIGQSATISPTEVIVVGYKRNGRVLPVRGIGLATGDNIVRVFGQDPSQPVAIAYPSNDDKERFAYFGIQDLLEKEGNDAPVRFVAKTASGEFDRTVRRFVHFEHYGLRLFGLPVGAWIPLGLASFTKPDSASWFIGAAPVNLAVGTKWYPTDGKFFLGGNLIGSLSIEALEQDDQGKVIEKELRSVLELNAGVLADIGGVVYVGYLAWFRHGDRPASRIVLGLGPVLVKLLGGGS